MIQRLLLRGRGRSVDKNVLFEPRCEKTGLWGFQPGPTQTGLYNHTGWLEAEISYLGSRGIVLSM